jgi:hypothetical protein
MCVLSNDKSRGDLRKLKTVSLNQLDASKEVGLEVNPGKTKCIVNKFAGFYSQWKFITLKTQYTTVDHSSQLF